MERRGKMRLQGTDTRTTVQDVVEANEAALCKYIVLQFYKEERELRLQGTDTRTTVQDVVEANEAALCKYIMLKFYEDEREDEVAGDGHQDHHAERGRGKRGSALNTYPIRVPKRREGR
jgi:uncharacterized protein (DUF433 family)